MNYFQAIVQTIMDTFGLSGTVANFVISLIVGLLILLALLWSFELLSFILRKFRADLAGPDGQTDHSRKKIGRDLKKAVAGSNWEVAAECSEKLGALSDAARYYQKSNRFEKAAILYERKGDYLKAASCYASSRHYEKAVGLYIKGEDFLSAAALVEKSGNFIKAAFLYDKGGKTDKAAAALDRYSNDSARTPTPDADTLEQCAQIYEQAGRNDTAAGYYVRAGAFQKAGVLYEKAGNRPEAAEMFMKGRGYNEAARLFEEIGEAGKAAEVRGMMHNLNGNYTEAAEQYALALDFVHAAECFHASGSYQRAAEMYLKAGYNIEAAGSYARTDEWEKAAELYEKSDMPDLAAALYEKHADLPRAIECFRRAGRHYKAGLLLMESGRFREALELFNMIDRERPEYSHAQAETGVCLFNLNNIDEAGDVLERALTGLDPGASTNELFYTLGLIYEKKGLRNEARKIFKRILSADESFKDTKDRVKKLGDAITAPSIPPSSDQTIILSSERPAERSGIEDRYQIVRELGRGGMGIVCQARDKLLERDVALKQLNQSLFDAEEARTRFLHEARAASRLNHPNIVSVYDVIEDKASLFIAMEYVEGISLREFLVEHPRPRLKLVLALVVQIVDALRSAHESGVVHRDIKPDNIMITRKGKVKITDFGIAHMSESTVTLSGSIVGTLKYMSPEQVKGETVTAASDLYSLGVVMYEMVAGAPPFTTGELTYHHVHTMPQPPKSLREDLPDNLNSVIMKCLEKEPSGRYESAQNLLADLKKVQSNL